ncbi:MAG: YihY family inner membrane protein [Enterobacterales bacterium]|nr:YihY family inner membrane protein [Enterobacterales bacterium]
MANHWIALKSFTWHLFGQFKRDKCSSVAAELTVTSLLAIVPLTALIFGLLSLIPDFQDLAVQLQQVIFQYFVPTTGESVQSHLIEFVNKTKGMSAVGFSMLIVTALLMMRTIDISFNNIWKIKRHKSVIQTFLVYWAVLTLGPILLGTSLLVTSYLQTLPLISDAVEENSRWLTLGLPALTEVLTFSLMYFVIPNRKYRLNKPSFLLF